MENTVAFGVLMELISVLGTFVTTPLFFGLSVLNILVISFVFNYIIGLCLGGISPRANNTREKNPEKTGTSSSTSFSAGVGQISARDGAKETYIGYGRY